MQVMQWCGSSRSSRRDRQSEKLQLLKISYLKAEQKQAVVGVLNTDAWLSGSAVEVVADFGFSPNIEDFDLRF